MNHSKATTPQCAPWCTDHDADDQMCRHPVTSPAGRMYLSNTDDGPMVFAYDARPGELTLTDAEAYFRAGLALVTAARTAVAA